MFREENKDRQAELFENPTGREKEINSRKFTLPKWSPSLSCENSFFIIIVFVMLMIACYSLGVEKGKHLVALNNNINQYTNPIGIQEKKTQTEPAVSIIEEPQKEKIKIRLETVQAEKAKPQSLSKDLLRKKPYIQVATFRTDKYAGKEINRLKSKGYRPFILCSGKFRQVCVGGYKDKTDAEKALKNLRRLYADCVLRK